MIDSSQLTYTGLLLAVFANQACLPVPSMTFLMMAGVLAHRGEMDPILVVALAVFACLVADGIWFWVGRRWGSKAIRLFCGLTADPRKSFLDAQERFRRHGLRLLVVSKFVPGMDGIMPPLRRRSRSVIHPVFNLRCSRKLPLVVLLRGSRLSVRQANRCGDCMGPAVRDRVRAR